MKWSRAKVGVNGLYINYYRFGIDEVPKSGPPVVLAHGITDSGQCWGQVAGLLVESYDVISPDARGHGLSDKPEQGYGPREHAADLAGLIGALEIEKPVLIGHSMGADNVAMFASVYPDLPRCLILEDPPWNAAADEPTPQEAAQHTDEWRGEIREFQSHSFAEMIEIARDSNPHWPEGEYPPWVDAKLHVDLRALDFVTSRVPWTEFVSSITCPVLLITADPEKGAIVTPQVAEEVCSMNSNIEVVRIEGAGHNIRREQFEKYADAVTGYLK
jgi:pimeloyl-ACP methyl ester carboxylesterase